MIKVVGIKIIDRIKEAGLTQGILSQHAAVITTRLGFHEVTDSVCSREAYIILHLNDNKPETGVLVSELKALGGIEVREVAFKSEEKMPDGIKVSNGIEILCVLVERDQQVVQSVQKVLTSYGCNIRTRLGVNEVFFGEPAGLIILELKGDENQRIQLEKDLQAIGHVHVRSMVF
jgi:hypothetical protein